MYSQSDLSDEIRRAHQALEKQGDGVAAKSALISLILAAHARINGEDKDFAMLCVQLAVYAGVDKLFREVKAGEKDGDEGPPIPGFERLQKHYVIQRDGDSCIVPIFAMTDDELEAKAKEHEGMATGHVEHAKELRRFREERARKD